MRKMDGGRRRGRTGKQRKTEVLRFQSQQVRTRECAEEEAKRAIRTRLLSALLRVHIVPIDQVVFLGPSGIAHLEGGFPLRCFQRLSRPYVATRQCRWSDNRNTRGTSIPVLSY